MVVCEQIPKSKNAKTWPGDILNIISEIYLLEVNLLIVHNNRYLFLGLL